MLNSETKIKIKLGTSLIKTDKIGAFAFSEPEFGSDNASMITFVVKTTDGRAGRILNGHKPWIENGTIADHIAVRAKTKMTKYPRFCG